MHGSAHGEVGGSARAPGPARPPACTEATGYALPWPRASSRPSDGSRTGPNQRRPQQSAHGPSAPAAPTTGARRGGTRDRQLPCPTTARQGPPGSRAPPGSPQQGLLPPLSPNPLLCLFPASRRQPPQFLPCLNAPCALSRGTEHWDNWDWRNAARGRIQGAPHPKWHTEPPLSTAPLAPLGASTAT